MAAIVDPERILDLKVLAKELNTLLPSYARPIFIRLVNTIDSTGTHKFKKLNYQNEAYDITQVKDPVYFYHPLFQFYIPLTSFIYDEVINGKMRI